VTSDTSAVAIVMPALGPSFGTGAGGDVHVQVVGAEPVLGDGLTQRECSPSGTRGPQQPTLHHVAQLP